LIFLANYKTKKDKRKQVICTNSAMFSKTPVITVLLTSTFSKIKNITQTEPNFYCFQLQHNPNTQDLEFEIQRPNSL